MQFLLQFVPIVPLALPFPARKATSALCSPGIGSAWRAGSLAGWLAGWLGPRWGALRWGALPTEINLSQWAQGSNEGREAMQAAHSVYRGGPGEETGVDLCRNFFRGLVTLLDKCGETEQVTGIEICQIKPDFFAPNDTFTFTSNPRILHQINHFPYFL